jgi:hypothetical protein
MSTFNFTPETDNSTHYFWMHANQADVGCEEELEFTYKVVKRGFSEEDIPMIEARQRNILLDPDARMHATQYDAAPTQQRIDCPGGMNWLGKGRVLSGTPKLDYSSVLCVIV